MTRVRALFTRLFWLDAAERAIKSFGQGAVGAFVQDVQPIAALNLFDADLTAVVGAGLGMAVLSILTSVASAPVSGMSPASVVND